MPSRPLVSIVMPSLNQAHFIRSAIDSVLNQDYAPIELVVVDGRSADGTVDILKSYGNGLRWVSESDGGQTPAINRGFRMATGEIIGWLNADDLYLPGAVRTGVDFLVRNPGADLVYGDADHIDRDGRFMASYPTEPFRAARLQETCFICQPAVFFRRRVFGRVGFLDEYFSSAMDYDYWVRIAKRCEIAYLPIRLAQSRLHPEAKTFRLRLEHQRLSVEVARRHFGSVPPSWLCAYASAVVEPWLPHRTGWQRALRLIAVTLIAGFQSLRFNHGMPDGAMRQWLAWLARKLQRQEVVARGMALLGIRHSTGRAARPKGD
jgi:glycosyltransferase involved in cell wall biosynthesis